MKRLIEFPLEGGGSIWIEVEEPDPPGGVVHAARPADMLARASQTFEEALDKIKPAASVLVAKLHGLSDPPDEMAVQFGLKLNAEAGAVVAAAGAEANYTVTLTWKRGQNDQSSRARRRPYLRRR
jgi:hypothetical protein